MPTLNWIGKEAVINHHKEVPFRLLEHDADLSHGQDDSGNIIVQGDNLHALKALLPRYAGQVKCIYIDPPYNTGNEGWIYNDNVNSVEIKKWLGDVVGKEGETLDRHDRWLCMMYPRLLLLKQFLCDDGAIFISIDDNEIATLRLLMDEIFGRCNFIATIAWQKIYTIKNSAKHFSEMHDYIVVYALKKDLWNRNLFPRTQSSDDAYSNPDNDPRGLWTSNALQSRNYYSKGVYSITCPGGKIIAGPPKGTYWRMEEDKLWKLNSDNRVWWGKSRNSRPRIKKFLSEAKTGVVPSTWWFHQFAGTNSGAKMELRDILNDAPTELFDTPKPWQLIQRILQLSTDKNSIILDSFSGSGTTAHAVLQQNSEDGGNRKFILVEMDANIAKNVTVERIKRICTGYNNAKGKTISPLNGSFQYFRLSEEPLFLPNGPVRHDVTFNQLREFIWFMETGSGLTISPLTRGQPATPFLGIHQEKAIFLLYNGILKDRSDIGGNVLNHRSLKFLDEITPPHFSGTRIVYAARSRFDKKKLNQSGIIFHQLPYELAVKTWL